MRWLMGAVRASWKLSEWPAETIRRPQGPNDAWRVIKAGSWKLVSFFIWRTQITDDRLQPGPSRAAQKPLTLKLCPSGDVRCQHWIIYSAAYTGFIKPTCQLLRFKMICMCERNVSLCVLEWYDLNQRATASTRTKLLCFTNPLLQKSIFTKVKQSRAGKCRSARQ